MLDALFSLVQTHEIDCSLDHPVAEARAAFNEAIAQKRIGPIKRALSENVVIVTGSDSGVINGREAQLDVWRQDFANPERMIFVRTPRCLSPSEVEPLVSEIGTWEGKPERPDGSAIGGDYFAKWREREGRWILEAEIFTTTYAREPLKL